MGAPQGKTKEIKEKDKGKKEKDMHRVRREPKEKDTHRSSCGGVQTEDFHGAWRCGSIRSNHAQCGG